MDFLLSDILDQHARWMPDDLAIGQGNTSFTWQQLNERVTTLTEIVTDDVDAVRIGQRVELVWEEHDEVVTIALFRPIDEGP